MRGQSGKRTRNRPLVRLLLVERSLDVHRIVFATMRLKLSDPWRFNVSLLKNADGPAERYVLFHTYFQNSSELCRSIAQALGFGILISRDVCLRVSSSRSEP